MTVYETFQFNALVLLLVPKCFVLVQVFCASPKIWLHFMPCPFTGPKMFCAGPSILCQPKNLTAFSTSSKTFVLAQKPIYRMQNIFLFGTKRLWLWQPQYENKFLVWHKTFGPAQNILGPVKGQGIWPVH